MKLFRLNQRGQFMPLSALVLFTSTVLVVASADVYVVARAKSKVTGLADAIALNIASQEAKELNFIADQNEWANHLYVSGDDLGTRDHPAEWMKEWKAMWLMYTPVIQGVHSGQGFMTQQSSLNVPLPPLSYAEADGTWNSYFFNKKEGAMQYGQLLQTINNAQRTFQEVYNRFLGAQDANGAGSNINTKAGSLAETLYSDIPELQDGSYHLVVWNDEASRGAAALKEKELTGTSPQTQQPMLNFNRGLVFKTHDMLVQYLTTQQDDNGIYYYKIQPPVAMSALMMVGPQDAPGYMTLDLDKTPQLTLPKTGEPVIGAAVTLVKNVQVPVLGSVPVVARSMAYIVNGSGEIGIEKKEDGFGKKIPHFSPTYWVRLGKA